jgi:pyruvate-ferredoxin/flavodoxin oxidoreductase
MGSACDTIEETVSYLNAKGEKVGAIKVRLYRPFSIKHLLQALPKTTQKIAVLDRTKEVGGVGEPLYTDIVAALKNTEGSAFKEITIIGGRYGLSSKEFNPSMVKAVFDHLDADCFHDFTVGITDDVTHKSIPINEHIETEAEDVVRCKFWGLGSDGTVSASKNSIKIIGNATDMHAQGYFSYDSKKSEGTTISYLRFGKQRIQSPYIPTEFDFIALHNDSYIGKYDILEGIKEGGTFLINTQYTPDEIFCHLTEEMQETIIEKNISFYCINAYAIAEDVGLEHHINTVMQTAFFELSGILETKKAMQLIKDAVTKQFSAKGKDLVEMNVQAIDSAQNKLEKVTVPNACPKEHAPVIRKIADSESEFITSVIEPCMRLKGDSIPVSKMPIDGKVPLGTSSLEKRRVATSLPRWIPENCIQCNQCAFVCPHATIRAKQIDPEDLKDAPTSFRTIKSTTKNERDLQFRIQVYVEDCVGCGNCAQVCPAKNKALVMTEAETERTTEQIANTTFFDRLPDNVADGFPKETVKGTQFKKPLFEFHGACKGCGETPYVRLLTQLFGDHMVIANATGCSSIYGGTFPTVPYTTTKDGRGPAWANSLFEDNAEYGLGMRLGIDANRRLLKQTLEKLQKLSLSESLQTKLNDLLANWHETGDDAYNRSQEFIHTLHQEKETTDDKEVISLCETILTHKDYLTEKAVWILGGDGWAYDIGFGGLDHVLSTGKNVNVLVLDTEVYSNTGGQSSKATPLGAVAKFAAKGKATGKKDLGLMMMSYGYVYVASVSMGGNRQALTKAFYEAQRYDGPSLIIAESPCIAHGINMTQSIEEEKKATSVGYWPLYTYDPRKTKEDKDPFTLLSKAPTNSYRDFLKGERRFSSLMTQYPECAQDMFKWAEEEAHAHYKRLESQKQPKQDKEQ